MKRENSGIKIIAGTHRGRTISVPNIENLRPTPNRIRETLFNWLQQDLSNKICLDLFAGSGALGFEALSRNATYVTMVEYNPIAIKNLHNIKTKFSIINLDIIRVDALIYLKNLTKAPDVLFLDPPYSSNLLQQSLDIIKNKSDIFINTVIYLEYQEKPNMHDFAVLKSGRAGSVQYALIQPQKTSNHMIY